MNGSEPPPNKELRFVTSVEQIVPYLNEIFDYQLDDDDGELDDVQPDLEELEITITTSDAVPNIYEEYVNFIDLSVLNPIMDPADCQRDTLIESEICERII